MTTKKMYKSYVSNLKDEPSALVFYVNGKRVRGCFLGFFLYYLFLVFGCSFLIFNSNVYEFKGVDLSDLILFTHVHISAEYKVSFKNAIQIKELCSQISDNFSSVCKLSRR